jgi:hypothetical protein
VVLFYDAVNISDYATSNHRIICQNYIGKDIGGNGRGLISRNIPGGGSEENYEEP